MTLFQAVLALATLLCSLVAGFLFAFAAVVMPGLRRLDDAAFIRAFQVVDAVIQRRQPLFVLVWAGSVLALMVSAVLGVRALGGVERMALVAAVLVYLLGVQLPTLTINVPLNNQLQKLDVAASTEAGRKRAREGLELRWNRWNVVRAVCASVATAILLLVLLSA